MKDIIVYSSRFCPYCHRAKALLKKKGATFQEIDVDGRPDVREAMRNKAGGRHTVPQIFIGGDHVGGCDDLYALEQKGKLDAKLAS